MLLIALLWVSGIVIATYVGATRGHTSRWWPALFLLVPVSSFVAIPLWLLFESRVEQVSGSGAQEPSSSDDVAGDVSNVMK
jgi:hypothetical protein